MSDPKMQTIEWTLETNQVGGTWTGDFEIEADATEAEIDAAVRDEISNYVSWGWSRKEAPDA